MPVLAIGIGVLLPLVLLEIVLRFLPVNEGLRTQPVDANNPVPRFQPDRTSIFSRGWNFSIVNTVRTNNAGFVNDQDYVTDDPRPLIALVGDSYVEAVMVPYAQTAAGRLAAVFGNTARVYSFGASGSALSQYLAYAKYVRDTFRPATLVVLVVGNDFDESLIKYKDWPGQTLFAEGPDGTLVPVRRDYAPSLPRRVAQHSALAMYLLTNVGLNGVQRLWQSWRKPAQETWVGNTAATASAERIADSRRAVDAFLARLPEAAGLPASNIVIAVEANRQLIYGTVSAEAAAASYFEVMRRDILADADAAGFRVIDLHQPFEVHWKENGEHFEWAEDWHWNGLGHALFAQRVEPVLRSLLVRPADGATTRDPARSRAVMPHPRAADTP